MSRLIGKSLLVLLISLVLFVRFGARVVIALAMRSNKNLKIFIDSIVYMQSCLLTLRLKQADQWQEKSKIEPGLP